MAANILYFVIFAGMFALMMRFGCGAHVMGHRGKHENSSSNRTRDAAENIGPNQSSHETDPVCGMSVNNAQAKSAVYDGQAYYFCSPACRDKFETNPVSYIKSEATGATLQKESHGTCG